jgi:hypothetical protein
MCVNAHKGEQICYCLLALIFRNLDFSMSYGRETGVASDNRSFRPESDLAGGHEVSHLPPLLCAGLLLTQGAAAPFLQRNCESRRHYAVERDDPAVEREWLRVGSGTYSVTKLICWSYNPDLARGIAWGVWPRSETSRIRAGPFVLESGWAASARPLCLPERK